MPTSYYEYKEKDISNRDEIEGWVSKPDDDYSQWVNELSTIVNIDNSQSLDFEPINSGLIVFNKEDLANHYFARVIHNYPDYYNPLQEYHKINFTKKIFSLNSFKKYFTKHIHDSKFEVQKLTCQILEIHSDFIVVDALVDKETNTKQKRKFDRSPLNGVIDIELGQIFNTTICTMPGERRFVYSKADKADQELFKKTFTDYFKNLTKSKIFNAAKSNDKDDF